MDRDTPNAARHSEYWHTLLQRDVLELLMCAMPEVRQTVAMLPVCVLPEAMLLLSGAIWCFGDQSLRPKEHGSLSELFHLLIQRCCLKQ